MEIRRATEEDLSEMVEIENHEILEGTAHFGTEPVSLADARSRFDREKHLYPYWVVVQDGEVAGFCRSGPWKTREAYRFSCEVGVYVRSELQGHGIGSKLYGQFLPSLKEAGFVTVIAGIAIPNPPSVRLHENFGFRHVGTLPKVGFKFERWHDVGYYVLTF